MRWSCADECQYGCMWRTVEAFQDRNWPVPQFYGKVHKSQRKFNLFSFVRSFYVQWPFLRFLGLQEPASVMFSFFNLIAHIRNLRKFRREVRPDSPCYKIWHVFSAVSILLFVLFSCKF